MQRHTVTVMASGPAALHHHGAERASAERDRDAEAAEVLPAATDGLTSVSPAPVKRLASPEAGTAGPPRAGQSCPSAACDALAPGRDATASTMPDHQPTKSRTARPAVLASFTRGEEDAASWNFWASVPCRDDGGTEKS